MALVFQKSIDFRQSPIFVILSAAKNPRIYREMPRIYGLFTYFIGSQWQINIFLKKSQIKNSHLWC